MFDVTTIVGLVTMIVTYIFGLISKRVKWFDDDFIPLQNIAIGLISGIICCFLRIENMNMLVSIITCLIASMAAGGFYDTTRVKK